MSKDKECKVNDMYISNNKVYLGLTDGRIIGAPLDWYPKLSYATPVEIDNWIMNDHKTAVIWTELELRINYTDLLEGKRTTEEPMVFYKWLKARGVQ